MREIVTESLVYVNGTLLVEGLENQGDYQWLDDRLKFDFKLKERDIITVVHGEGKQFRICIYEGHEFEEILHMGLEELTYGVFKR